VQNIYKYVMLYHNGIIVLFRTQNINNTLAQHLACN